MSSQRGSVALIAIVFLLFLSIIGIAWLPLLSSEAKQARLDSEEQLAWYAAEAGYKYAYAGLKNSSGSNDNYWDQTRGVNISEFAADPSKLVDKVYLNGSSDAAVTYAVGVTGISDLGGGEYAIASGPHTVTSVGRYNGMTRIITEKIMTGGSGGSGGIEEGEENLTLPGLVQAGGTVTVVSDPNHFNLPDIDTDFHGNLYGSNFIDSVTGKKFTNNWTQSTGRPALKTRLPERLFDKSKYADLQPFPDGKAPDIYSAKTVVLESGKDYYWDFTNLDEEMRYLDASKASGRIVFIANNTAGQYLDLSELKGPPSGEPVTFVFSGTDPVGLGGTFTGNVRIFAAGDFNFGRSIADTAKGLTMIMANGDLNIVGWIMKGFLSSDKNVQMSADYVFLGQIQCRGDFKTSQLIQFNDEVLKAFKIPKGMR